MKHLQTKLDIHKPISSSITNKQMNKSINIESCNAYWASHEKIESYIHDISWQQLKFRLRRHVSRTLRRCNAP